MLKNNYTVPIYLVRYGEFWKVYKGLLHEHTWLGREVTHGMKVEIKELNAKQIVKVQIEVRLSGSEF